MTESLRVTLPRRGYLGFEVEARPGETKAARERWFVSELDAGGPAEQGGLRLDDEVVALDGREVESLAALRTRAGGRKSGAVARLTVVRAGSPLDLTLTALSMPKESLRDGEVELGDVSWRHEGQTLRARTIWSVPRAPAWAAIWLLPSAALISQENPLTPWDPSFHLVDALTSLGVMTLRVDRSGLGDSEGPHARYVDLDAELRLFRAARDTFFARCEGEALPAFLYGRSLGGMLAPLLAREGGFSGVVVWGTTAEAWYPASLKSFRRQLERTGATGNVLEERWRAVTALLELVYEQGLTPAVAHERAPHLATTLPEEFEGAFVHDRVASYYHQLNAAGVARAWAEVTCPVLAIHAEYDILTERAELEEVARSSGGPARFLSIPGVDHFMHTRPSMLEAVRVPWGGTFSPQVPTALARFIEEITGRERNR